MLKFYNLVYKSLPSIGTLRKFSPHSQELVPKIHLIIILYFFYRYHGNCCQTGTLTEDGMDMWGVLPVDDRRFKAAVKDMTQLSREPLQLGMASCHSLTLINGALSGDPLDVKVRANAHTANCKRLKLSFAWMTLSSSVCFPYTAKEVWLLLTAENRLLGEHQNIRGMK
jgi:hypothetical protein